MDKPKRIYIAGRMRGEKDFNFSLFDSTADRLRSLGHLVFSPAEHDRDVCGDTFKSETGDPNDLTNGFDLAKAFEWDAKTIIHDVDTVVFLDGYQDSVGAMAEMAIAKLMGRGLLDQNLTPIFDALETAKPSNPKDCLGSLKVPLHLWPETATVMGSLGLLDGALKYGRANFRVIGIRYSIYIDALRRHVNALFEGEDLDPDSGLPHEAHALACLAIIIDAKAAGKLTDDRQVSGGYRHLIDELTPHVARLKQQYASRNPKHYTIADKI